MASQDGSGTSRLAKMQMRFQQKQQEEREQRRIEMTLTKSQLDESTSLNSSFGHGKVRQMFDERRRGTGIDKSYPLKPISTTRSTSGGKPTATKTLRTTTTTVKKSPLINNVRLNNNNITTTTPPLKNESNKKSQNITNNINGIGDIYGNNSNNNATKMFLNKRQDDSDNFSPCGDTSIFDETFPDNNVDLNDNEIIRSKLLNVGSKLSSLKLDDKQTTSINGNSNKINNNDIMNGNQFKNNIKLKPVVTKKNPSNQVTSTATAQKPLKTNVKSLAKRMAPTAVENMVACSVCNRNFNTDRISKHEEICKKTAAKQRKQFDTALHRVKGTEAETFVRRGKIGTTKLLTTKRPIGSQITTNTSSNTSAASTQQGSKKSSSWRKKHEEFIEAIRAAKKVQQHLARGGKLSDLPPPPPSENPDYVQCPHCNRRFNEAAASRHIPKCANMLHNKPKPGATKPATGAKTNLSRTPVTKTGLAAGSSMLKR